MIKITQGIAKLKKIILNSHNKNIIDELKTKLKTKNYAMHRILIRKKSAKGGISQQARRWAFFLNLSENGRKDLFFSIPRSSVSPVSGIPIDLVRSYPRLS
jgi:hypothetical protein